MISYSKFFLPLLFVGCTPAITATIEPEVLKSKLSEGAIQITGMSKVIESVNEANSRRCQAWQLTESDVRQFFIESETIAGEERHAYFLVQPCKYVGQLKSGSEVYNFVINAGSHGAVYGGPTDDEYLYGCKTKRCDQLFLSTVIRERY